MTLRILITGANRGLGLEMSRQLAERGARVFATCRQPQQARELQALAAAREGLEILPLDVADGDSRAALVAALNERCDGLDWLVNNAAIDLAGGHFAQIDEAALLHMFLVNSAAPLLLSLALLPLLRAGQEARVIYVSSALKYAARARSSPGYSASKAALNMFARKQASQLRPQNIIVFALEPGWVRTDMGGAHADIGVEQSIAGCLRVIDRLTMDDSGAFRDYRGDLLTW